MLPGGTGLVGGVAARVAAVTLLVVGIVVVGTVEPVGDRSGQVRTQGDAPSRLAGLDGMRGVAVLCVVAFHLWPDAVPGGYLGVSVFFALSGYLITSLLLAEHTSSGSVSLRAFYARRIRRLLPLSTLTLAAVAVVWAAAGWWSARLRDEVVMAVVASANWQHAVAQTRYGADARSPVLHYWSLAVEEQVYLLLPVVVAVALRAGRRRLGVLLAVATVASAASMFAVDGRAMVYYATFTRAGELLAGAVAAVVAPRVVAFFALAGAGSSVRRLARAGVAVSFLVSAAVLVVCVASLDITEPWVYRGALPFAGVASAVVVATLPHCPRLARAVDVRPLAWCGSVSYGLYLFHWPLLVAFRALLAPAAVPVAVLGVSFAFAAGAARFVERPLRQSSGVRPALAVSALAVAVIAGVVVVAPVAPTVGDFTTDVPSLLASVPPPGAGVDQVRVAVVGDSKALALTAGFAAVATPHLPVRLVSAWSGLGCTTVRGGDVRSFNGETYTTDESCDWQRSLRAVPRTDVADVALVWFGTWDVRDRRLDRGDAWFDIADADYRRLLAAELDTLTDTVRSATGARIVAFVDLPVEPNAPYPERFARWNAQLVELAARRDDVAVFRFAAFVAASGDGVRLLPDGIHPSFAVPAATAPEIVAAFFVPEVVAASSR